MPGGQDLLGFAETGDEEFSGFLRELFVQELSMLASNVSDHGYGLGVGVPPVGDEDFFCTGRTDQIDDTVEIAGFIGFEGISLDSAMVAVSPFHGHGNVPSHHGLGGGDSETPGVMFDGEHEPISNFFCEGDEIDISEIARPFFPASSFSSSK